MTDDIPCEHCGRLRGQHVEIVGAGRVCPVSAVTYKPSRQAIIDAQAAEIAGLREALQAMLNHSCVADNAAEDKFPEDHEAERLARAALGGNDGR